MPEVTDDFGRVGNFKSADFDSLADALKSAVGKAVDYAAGKAKTTGDEMKKEFDRLVDAMEELGDDIKDNLKEVKGFVEQVKKASESMDKRRGAKSEGASGDLAAAQSEQTRILQMILKNQQKAIAAKAAKFTSGSASLSAPSPRGRSMKDAGFRPKGADKIPAMLSPGEFVVSKKGAAGNESMLNQVNRGYFKGGKVRPKYLSEGSGSGGWSGLFGGRRGSSGDISAKVHLIVDGTASEETRRQLEKEWAEMGHDVEVKFSEEFDKGLKQTSARWITSLTSAFIGQDPFATLFEGGVKDITDFRREMRNLAFQTEGITGEFRKSQAEFASIGTNITGRTGKSVTAFQEAYMANARKGFKNQKAGMKVLESGLKLSTLIGSETQATATLFADWHRELGLGAGQMERMANSMQHVARRTGVTGDELVGVMKSSEQILKNLRKQGNLTTTAAKNVVSVMAEMKKDGFEEEGQKMLSAMSGYSGFQSADEGTKAILGIGANRGLGVGGYQELMFGNITQDAEKLGNVAEGIKGFIAESLDIDPNEFDFDMITEEQRRRLSVIAESQGTTIGAMESGLKALSKQASGLGGELADLQKIKSSKTAPADKKAEAEKKMNEVLLSSSMDLLQSVQQATDKFGDKTLAEIGQVLGEDNKFGRDFATGTNDLASMASYMSSATKGQFGLSGTQDQMAEQIKALSAEKQMQLRYTAAAEQLDKKMKDQGKAPKNFTAQMTSALTKGDTTKVKALSEEMGAVFSEAQVKDAAAVDPQEELNLTMGKLNETIRDTMSPLLGGIVDLIGGMGLLAITFGAMGTSLYNMVPWDIVGKIADPDDGILNILQNTFSSKNDFFRPFFAGMARGRRYAASEGVSELGPLTSLMKGLNMQLTEMFGSTFTKALGPAVLLLGGIKGVMESSEAGRTKTEGFMLGALTGGAKTGSFITGRYGDDAGAVDKTLGVAGAAAWGAMAGAAISVSLGGMDFGASIFLGAVIGAFTEIVKIITHGTDILADLFAPFQAIGDWLSGIFGDMWSMLKSFATLNPVTIVGSLISGIFGIITKTIYAVFAVILGAIRMVVIGLPKLILKALMMIWDIPRAIAESIKSTLAGLVDNEWFGPIFKVLSDAFNSIYDGFMAIWTPISEIFSGLYTVFNDLGKALFGASEGGGLLSGFMWILQKAVYGLAYVISWLISPIKVLAWALGLVLKIVGALIKGIIAPFQYLYDTLVGHSIVPDLVFGIIKFFAMLPVRIFKSLLMLPFMLAKALLKVPIVIGRIFLNSLSSIGKLVYDNLLAPFSRIWDFIGQKTQQAWNFIKGMFDIRAWSKWVGELGTYVFDGFKSALQGVWDWIRSWVPGLEGASKGLQESAKEQEATRATEGDKISHAVGGLVGAVGSLAKGNLSEAGGKAWSSTKETAGAAWEGTKAVASYFNPFNYFKEGTKKIEKPGLGMLHAGEMVVPRSMVDKIAAMGNGAFGSIKSFVGGKLGGGEGGMIGALKDKFQGFGDMFKNCCPKESVEGAEDAMSEVPKAIMEALGKVDDGSFLGDIKNRLSAATGHTNKFFKPLTTGFIRARKRGEGFFTAMTKGFKSQYMSMTEGGKTGPASYLSSGMDWIKDSIFGSKEGDKTKKGILSVIKDGLFGSNDETKKGLFQVFKEGVFGKDGAGSGILGWMKEKLFGHKTAEGEMGPEKPGLLDKAKDKAMELYGNLEEGLLDKAKGKAMDLYDTAKGKLFGHKTAAGEMGPEKPGMLDVAKIRAMDMYGKGKEKLFGQKMAEGEMGPAKPGLLDKARGKAMDLYDKGKEKLFGKGPAEALESAGAADAKVPGKMDGFKDKMMNIAEGIKKFSGTQVLAGAMNLIPSSIGLAAMIPGSYGAKMMEKIDGERLSTSLTGLGKGIASLGNVKVMMGAAAMVLVGIASLGLIPAIPMFAALSVVGPMAQIGLKALGKGLSAFGKAAMNPYTWLGVLLLGALNVVMIPLAFALGLAAPAIQAFGTAVKSAFEGAGSLLKGVGESIGMILKEITISKALALGVAAVGIGALGLAMVAFAAGGAAASWIGYFGGDGVFTQIMGLAAMGPNLMIAANAIELLGSAFQSFAANKGGGWSEWFSGSDGVIEGFKRLSEVGTPQFVATADAIHKVADGLEKMQGMNAVATAGGVPAAAPAAGVEPVHLQDITGSILRERAGSGGSKLQSDELSRMEETAYKQVEELEQIRQGINELVSLMRPRGSVAGGSDEAGPGKTKDPRRPLHAARFGKMKYGTVGGLANRSFVTNGEV
jgi:hypothetical protein